MTTLTPEQRQEIEQAGNQPVHLEDPETHVRYVLIKREVYESLREVETERQKELLSASTRDAGALQEEDSARSMYPFIDKTFREGWEPREMAEYDEYEKHRP